MSILDAPRAATLARAIRLARVAADLDQAQLADAVGVKRSTLSSWETGRTEPNATAFVRLARVTGQSLDWFATAVAERPTANDGAVARPEGFEPPTFWSGASALLVLTLGAMRQAVAR